MKSKEVKEFRLGELFCGPGGLAYAAVNSQIEDSEYKIVHKWANDYDLDTCKTYTRNICPEEPDSVICGDLPNLRANSASLILHLTHKIFICSDIVILHSS